jgi:hypothetical protein
MNTMSITNTNPLTAPGARSILPGTMPGDSPFSMGLKLAQKASASGNSPSSLLGLTLGQHASAPGDADRSGRDEVRDAARSLVAISFIQPLLTEARQDPFRSEMFHGGFAEDAFGAQLDSIIAEQITKRADMPLVESVYRQIAGPGQTNHGTRVNTHG